MSHNFSNAAMQRIETNNNITADVLILFLHHVFCEVVLTVAHTGSRNMHKTILLVPQ
jgi:hypothetical protein